MKAKNAEKTAEKPVIISYLRFSRAEQLLGDSTRRQLELSEAWAKKNNVAIDTSLSDKGISAFRGNNAKTGALAAFLALVEQGKIPQGSVLLVESLDRLSRTELLTALQQFLAIVTSGVKIVTLADGFEYDKSNCNLQNLMYSLMVMSRAHEESAIKSQRLTAAWNNKRKNIDIKPLTKRMPAWCKLEKGKIVMDKEKQPIVKKIFKMAIAGHGVTAITKQLNKDYDGMARVNYFNKSYVFKILRSRNAIGEFQMHKMVHLNGKKTREPIGEPIKDYYPAIVTEDEFYAANHRITQRKGTGGPSSKFLNLFPALLYSIEDKSRYQIQDKGYGKRYVSANAIMGVKGAALATGFPVKAFEKAVCTKLLDGSIFANAQNDNGDIEQQKASALAQLAEIDAKIMAIEESILEGNGSAASVASLLTKLGERKTGIETNLKSLNEQSASPQKESSEAIIELITKTMLGTFTIDERTALRSHFVNIIERIDALFQRQGRNYLCSSVVTLKNGNTIDLAFLAKYIPTMERDSKGHPIKGSTKTAEPEYVVAMLDVDELMVLPMTVD